MTRTKGPKQPHKLLDELIQENRLRSDSHLADELGYTKGRICEVRKGRPVSAELRCTIQRKYGWSLKRIDMLAPPDQKGDSHG